MNNEPHVPGFLMKGGTVNHIGVALRWTYRLAINITVGQESAELHMHVLVADVIPWTYKD